MAETLPSQSYNETKNVSVPPSTLEWHPIWKALWKWTCSHGHAGPSVHHRNTARLRSLILIDIAGIGSDASAGGSSERREAEAVAGIEANYGREAFGAILSAGSGRRPGARGAGTPSQIGEIYRFVKDANPPGNQNRVLRRSWPCAWLQEPPAPAADAQ